MGEIMEIHKRETILNKKKHKKHKSQINPYLRRGEGKVGSEVVIQKFDAIQCKAM